MRTFRHTIHIAIAGSLIACNNDATTTSVAGPQFGKPGGSADPTASWLIPLDASGLAFSSDGAYAAGGYSVYQDGVCGVDAKIFATTAASNSGDAIMQTDNPKSSDRKCKSYPRKVTFTHPDGFTEATTFFGNLHEIQNTVYSIPIGSTVTRPLNLSSSTSNSRCGVIRFRTTARDGTVLGGDEVNVTRVAADTWDVQSQPHPNDKGYCDNTGGLIHMQVRFRIVAN